MSRGEEEEVGSELELTLFFSVCWFEARYDVLGCESTRKNS